MAIPGASWDSSHLKPFEGCWQSAAQCLIEVSIVWNVAQSNHRMFALTVFRHSRPFMAPFNAHDGFLWPILKHNIASAAQRAFSFALAYSLTLVAVILENLSSFSSANNSLSSNDFCSPIRRDTAI